MDQSAQSMDALSPSARRVVFLAGLVGIAVCAISVALDSAPASASEGESVTTSVVVEVSAPVDEAVGPAREVVRVARSSQEADIPVLADALDPTAGQAAAELDTDLAHAIPAVPVIVEPIAPPVLEQLPLPAIPRIDVPAVPSALSDAELPLPIISVGVDRPDAAPPTAPARSVNVVAAPVVSDVGAATAPTTLQAASVGPGTPLDDPAGMPRDPGQPLGPPAQPRSDSGPSGTGYPAAADVAGEQGSLLSRRASAPISWAAARHTAPSFDPGCTPD